MSFRPSLSFAVRAAVVLASFSLGAMAAPSCASDENNRPTGLIYGATSSSTASGAASSGESGAGGGKGGAGGAGSGGSGGAGGVASGNGGNGGAATNGAGGIGGAMSGVGGALGSGGAPFGTGGNGGGGPSDAAACTTVVEGFPIALSPHIMNCSPVVYDTNPPTSGPHYGNWAKFQAYSSPVPRGYWVHDLEHGAVVITYNCPAGCDAEVQALLAYLDTLPPDPLCTPPLKARYVITPDPLLDVLFAASAWGWSLKSNCFDLPALGTFITDHYAMGPENFCSDGWDVLDQDAGFVCP